jgi:hypothetical protein
MTGQPASRLPAGTPWVTIASIMESGTSSPASEVHPAHVRSDRPQRTRKGVWIAIALVCLGASAALVYPPITKYALYDPGLGGRDGDVGQYVRIYQGVPLQQVARPWRYRVFTPLLARLVPAPPQPLLRYFDMDADKLVKYHFGMVNLLGLALAGLLMVGFCEALGFTTLEGLLGALLFYTSFTVVNFAGTPLVDAWAYAFLMLGLVAALRGSMAWLLVAALVGMLAKETTLLLVPAVLLLGGPPRTVARKLLALLPGVIVYLVFRFVFYPGGYGHPGDPGTAWSTLISRMQQGPYWAFLLFDGGVAFGLLWPLAAVGAWSLREARHHPLMRLAWLVPGIMLVPFLIGSNVGRIWFYAFPALIPLAVTGIRQLLGGPRVPAGEV